MNVSWTSGDTWTRKRRRTKSNTVDITIIDEARCARFLGFDSDRALEGLQPRVRHDDATPAQKRSANA